LEFFASAGAVSTARAVKPVKIKGAIRMGSPFEALLFLDKKHCDNFWPRPSARGRMLNVLRNSQECDRDGK
jgi:hypothetical protein